MAAELVPRSRQDGMEIGRGDKKRTLLFAARRARRCRADSRCRLRMRAQVGKVAWTSPRLCAPIIAADDGTVPTWRPTRVKTPRTSTLPAEPAFPAAERLGIAATTCRPRRSSAIAGLISAVSGYNGFNVLGGLAGRLHHRAAGDREHAGISSVTRCRTSSLPQRPEEGRASSALCPPSRFPLST